MNSKKESHYWWFDSHNTSNCSPWLESTLTELNEKTKTMLKLVEDDADSFAQRAEMYYKKRPELISMVEDFYRAHRSLAERYDQLKGNRSVNVKSPLKHLVCHPRDELENGLSSIGGSVNSFDSFTEVGYGSEDESPESEVDDPELDDVSQKEKTFSSWSGNNELTKLTEELDRLQEENEIQKRQNEEVVNQLAEKVDELKKLREEFDAIKHDPELDDDSEKEKSFSGWSGNSELTKLREELDRLREENEIQKRQNEELVNQLAEKGDELKKFREEFDVIKEENASFEEELDRLQEENEIQKRQKEELVNQLAEKVDELKKLREEIEAIKEENAPFEELERLQEENEIQKKKNEEVVNQLAEKVDELKKIREEFDAIKEGNAPFEEVKTVKCDVKSVKLYEMDKSEEVTTMVFEAERNSEMIKLWDEIQNLGLERMKQRELVKQEFLKIEAENSNLKEALDLKESLLEHENLEKVEVTRLFEEVKTELDKMREEIQTKKTCIEEVLLREKEAKRLLVKTTEELANLRKETERKDGCLVDALEEKDEEKRAVIRQLSLAMEILREDNQLLKNAMMITGLSKKKNAFQFQMFKGVQMFRRNATTTV